MMGGSGANRPLFCARCAPEEILPGTSEYDGIQVRPSHSAKSATCPFALARLT